MILCHLRHNHGNVATPPKDVVFYSVPILLHFSAD